MKIKLAWSLTLIALMACSTGNLQDPNKSMLTTGHPSPNIYPAAAPGDTHPLARAYKGAPPQIPHRIQGFTIDRTSNDCLDCHLKGEEVSPGHSPTLVPASHFENPFTGEKMPRSGSMVTGMRNQCMQCHVPQAI